MKVSTLGIRLNSEWFGMSSEAEEEEEEEDEAIMEYRSNSNVPVFIS